MLENGMLLGVNIDHIATLRNARGGKEPDVFTAALWASKCGIHDITMHLREDRRHIKEDDVKKVCGIKDLKVTLEMAPTDEMQSFVLSVKPYGCCIVPEKRQEITTESGLDVAGEKVPMMADNVMPQCQEQFIAKFIKPILDANIVVSLFLDPDIKQINSAKETGVSHIVLNTTHYANAFGTKDEDEEFLKLKSAAEYAQSLGLVVNVGHGLTYNNVQRMHEIKGINELDIGHAIIARAIFTGLEPAIIEMKRLIL